MLARIDSEKGFLIFLKDYLEIKSYKFIIHNS